MMRRYLGAALLSPEDVEEIQIEAALFFATTAGFLIFGTFTNNSLVIIIN